MKDLQEYIAEAIINEAAPKFSNDEDGVKDFCEYVFDQKFVKYVVNPDLTISLESKSPSKNLHMDTKDLTEIPEFIVFSNMDNYRLGLGTNSKCKVKEWKPRVNGYCAGIIVSDRPKVMELDLSECEIRNGLLCIEDTGIKSIVGAHGEGVQVYIMKNKKLETVDIKNISSCTNGSWLSKNKKLEVNPSDLPKGIRVEKNAQNEKIYVS